VEVRVLVSLRVDRDSRVGIVRSRGIIHNWNTLLPTSETRYVEFNCNS